MKHFFLLLLFSGMACYAASPERPVGTVDFKGARPMRALTLYKRLTSKLVVVTMEVRTSNKPVTFQFDGISAEEALTLIEGALLAQADVEIVPQEDGSLLARQVAKPSKPNQALEPTRLIALSVRKAS
jgi:hypothetical protein